MERVKMLRAWWSTIGWTTRVCVLVWIIFGGFGLFQILTHLSVIQGDRPPNEVALRNASWSPIYGFGHTCAPHLLANASILLVDPMGGPQAGFDAFDVQTGIDRANTVTFVYELYPRPETTEAHSTGGRNRDNITQDYVAIWAQRSFRSESAYAAAQTAATRISSSNSVTKVCSYEDAVGNWGVVYALSSRARAAQTRLESLVAQEPSSVLGIALIRVILGLIGLWGIGFIVALLVGQTRIPRALALLLGLPLGSIAVTVEMLVLSFVGISWSLPLLCAPWLLLALLACILFVARHGLLGASRLLWSVCGSLQRTYHALRSLNMLEGVACAFLVLLLAVVVGAATLNLPAADGFAIYYFKARAFYHDLSVVPYYQEAMHSQDLVFTTPAHPPLVPLTVVWLYFWIGGVNEHVSLLLWPAWYIVTLGIFYWTLRGVTSRNVALWLTVAFSVCAFPFTGAAVLGSFTDMPLGAFLLMGSAFLWRKLSFPTSHGELIIAGVLLGSLGLIKEEGLVLSLVAIILFLVLYVWEGNTERLRRLAPVAIGLGVPCLLILAPALAIKFAYAPVELLVGHSGLGAQTLSYNVVVTATGYMVRAAYYWLPVVVLLGCAVIVRLASGAGVRWMPRRTLFLLALVSVQSLVDIAAMAVSPNEVHMEVATGAVRLILQLTPLLLLAAFDLWTVLVQQDGERATSSPLTAQVATSTRTHR